MLEWTKKDDGSTDHPMRNPASAAKLLAEMRGADPLLALGELGAWVETLAGSPGGDEQVRGEILSLIQEAGGPHGAALLAQVLAPSAATQAAREASWTALVNYLRSLAVAQSASATRLMTQARANPALQLPGAAGAARALHACRMLAKACLVRYASVPPQLWRLAYGVHGEAEQAGCAATSVRMHAAQHAATTATQELLRLLMLQSSAPEMLAPEQIEVADRVTEQFGGEFTLRPRGVLDNAFCFDPASDRPPMRTDGRPAGLAADVRCFGAGAGLDSLGRLHKQLASARSAEVKAFGKDIAPHTQLSTLQHLLGFWSEKSPYTPPARTRASGALRVVRGYAQVWQQLSQARSGAFELALVEDGDAAPQAPEAWDLQDTGGNELGADIPKGAGDWARCGDVVAVSMPGSDEWWLGLIRAMHAEAGHALHGTVYVLSHHPQAVQFVAHVENDEETVYSGEAARQFDFNRVRAIIVSDGAAGAQTPNMLLPPEGWKAGRVYEVTLEGAARELRGLQLLRRRDDYVRATFEWSAAA